MKIDKKKLAQQKRREERLKHRPPPYKEKVELIDGNFSRYPEGYCDYYGGYMTRGLMDTHRCDRRDCKRLIPRERVDEIE